MTLRVRIANLERRAFVPQVEANRNAAADLESALTRIAARGGIGDPERASFAQLLAVRVYGDGERPEDRAALEARCRQTVEADPDGRTALGALARTLLCGRELA